MTTQKQTAIKAAQKFADFINHLDIGERASPVIYLKKLKLACVDVSQENQMPGTVVDYANKNGGSLDMIRTYENTITLSFYFSGASASIFSKVV